MIPMPRSSRLRELLVGALLFGVIVGGLFVALLIFARPSPPFTPSVEVAWPSKPVLENHRP